MKERRNEAARLRAAFAALGEEPSPAGQEVDGERIWRAAAGELPPDETAELIDQAAESGEVAEAWRLARAMQAERRKTEGREAQVVPILRRPALRWGGLAAAAALLLAIGLWPTLRSTLGPTPPVYRATDPGALATLVPDDATLPRDRFLLRWTPAEGEGWLYHLRLSTDDMQRLVSIGGVEKTEYLVPEEELAPAADGSRLYWRVEAAHPDGRRMASPTFFVRLE